MTTLKTTIRNRRIDVAAPGDFPDGTEVVVTIGTSASDENRPMAADEIARVLAAMQRLEALEIPEAVAADLDAWERTIEQRGIDHKDPSMADAFP